MNKAKNLDEVLSKVEKLQESMRLSEEVFPVINDLFKFIKEIIPLMVEVNTFMKHSTQKIPSAAENLTNVSKTTELATNQVMDKLDVITAQLEKLRAQIKSEGASEKSLKLVDTITDETSEIIYAFQFQDITSQQLEHVNRILEAIYEKFVSLFQTSLKLKDNTKLGSNVIEVIEQEVEQNIKEKEQDFHKRTEDKIHKSGISQDEIDNFFKSQIK